MRHNLVQLRKSRQFTQKKLANSIGVTMRHYQNLESGDSDGSVKLWKLLSEKFNTPIEILLAREADELRENFTTKQNKKGKEGGAK